MADYYDQNLSVAFDSIQDIVQIVSGLNISIESFAYVVNGGTGSYAGTASTAMTDDSINYVYLNSAGSLQTSTSGYPDNIVKIARVVAVSGSIVNVFHDRAIVGSKSADYSIIPLLNAIPSTPSNGYASLYGRTRHGRAYLDLLGSNGRDVPFQPFLGMNRVAMQLPETGSTIRTWGIRSTNVGTVSTPTLASTNLSTSIRRWRMTSAATANSAAENRTNITTMWRGNAAGLGGFTFITRISLATLSTNCRGFFGLLSSTGATSTSQVPSNLKNCLGFAWDATETNFRFQHNDASGAATRVDLGSTYATNDTSLVFTFFIYASPNDSVVYYRVVKENTGDFTEGSVSTDLPASTTFLTHHLYMNNGGDASAIAYDCSGIYIETDY